MAKQIINVGTSANDGAGDKNRVAFQKCNSNFDELYNSIQPTQQYKFLLSQSGADDPQTATSGSLTQGVTYEIVAFETGDNFIPSGAPNNTVGTKWIANGVAPTWSNGSEIGWNGGLAYIVGEVCENTLGGGVWFEISGGDFSRPMIKSDGLFTEFKTGALIQNNLIPEEGSMAIITESQDSIQIVAQSGSGAYDPITYFTNIYVSIEVGI